MPTGLDVRSDRLRTRSPSRPRNGRPARIWGTALAAALLVGLVAAPTTSASTPSNDDSADAILLATLPYRATVDLTEASLQNDEPFCGGQVASVWYRYVAPAEQTLTVAVPPAEPTTRVCILPDSIGAGTYRMVTPSETVDILLDAGRTYFILLGSIEAGRSATLDLDVGPPYFDVTITLDPKGVADHVSGAALVGGTLSCSDPASAFISVRVQEKLPSKRAVDASDNRFDVPCSTAPSRWQMQLSANTAFVPGVATVSVFVGAGGDIDQFTATVKLGPK
jgi:hypothetical protein